MSSWWPWLFSGWTSADERDFEVVIYEEDYKELCAWVLCKPHIETGGDLFGLWADKYTAVIQLALGPGKRCRRTTASFYQDVEYLQDVGSHLTQNEGVCHIGEWHSHHQLGLARPSGGDENTVWNNMPTYKLSRFVIFIANIEASRHSYNVNIGCFLFEIDSEGNHLPVLQGKFKILHSENPFSRKSEVSERRNKGEEDKRGDEFNIDIKGLELKEETWPFVTMKRRIFEVTIYEEDYKKLCAWVLRKPNIETGGDLFGLWVDEHEAVIQLALGPGKGCTRTTTSFYQDVGYLEEVGSYLTQNEGVCHIGEWHSHHRLGLARPSSGDENTVWNNMPTYKLSRFVIFIANIEASRQSYKVNIGCFLFEIDSKGNHLPVLQGKFKILHSENSFSRKKEVNERRNKGEEEKRGDDCNIDIKDLELTEGTSPFVTMKRQVNNKRNKPSHLEEKDQPQPKKEKNAKEDGSPGSSNAETPDPVKNGSSGSLSPGTHLTSNAEQKPDGVKSQQGVEEAEGGEGDKTKSIETERKNLGEEEEEGDKGEGSETETKEKSGKELEREEEEQTDPLGAEDEVKIKERTAAEKKEQMGEDDDTKELGENKKRGTGAGHDTETKERSRKDLEQEEEGQAEQIGEEDEVKNKERTAAEEKEQMGEDDHTKELGEKEERETGEGHDTVTKERSGKDLEQEEEGQAEQIGAEDEVKNKERTAAEEKEQMGEDDDTKALAGNEKRETGGGHDTETKERSRKDLEQEEEGQAEQIGEEDEVKNKERTAAEEKEQMGEDDHTKALGEKEERETGEGHDTVTKERSRKDLEQEEEGQAEQIGEEDEVKNKERTAAEEKEQMGEDDDTKALGEKEERETGEGHDTVTKERSGKDLEQEEEGQAEQIGAEDEVTNKERTAAEEKEQMGEDDDTKELGENEKRETGEGHGTVTKERSRKDLEQEEEGQAEQIGEEDEVKNKERTAAEEKEQIGEDDNDTKTKERSGKELGEEVMKSTEAETMQHQEANKTKAENHDNQQNENTGDQRNVKEDDSREEERMKTLTETRQPGQEQENPQGGVDKEKSKRSSRHGLQENHNNAERKPEQENPDAGASVNIKPKTAEQDDGKQTLGADPCNEKGEKEGNPVNNSKNLASK